MRSTTGLTLIAFLLTSGCVSTVMYTPDGFLTEYGVKQTSAENDAIRAECSSAYQRTDSAYYDCHRQVIPLAMRYGSEYAEILSERLYASRNVVLGYEAGNISEETTVQTLDKLGEDFAIQRRIWEEQYNRVVGARNAREKELARQ